MAANKLELRLTSCSCCTVLANSSLQARCRSASVQESRMQLQAHRGVAPTRQSHPRLAQPRVHHTSYKPSLAVSDVGFQHRNTLHSPQASATGASTTRSTAPRLIQHKAEAFWFYRFLSIVYDSIVNPGHWTEDMREDALSVAQLDNPNLKVVDVGAGTGFCTLGIVKTVQPENVTMIDQSPHQLAKAKQRPALKGVTILEGDAEDLPFPTDSFDRYVSAGSIEYWPSPPHAICESYRVLKEGGVACIIGPVHPTFWLSRFFADLWMLFPKEEEYIEWMTQAGFTDVKIKRIGPSWYRGVRRHGLIMGCSVTGVKPKAGESPLVLPPKPEESGKMATNPVVFLFRLLVGTLAGFYYFVLPIYMYLKHLVWPKDKPM